MVVCTGSGSIFEALTCTGKRASLIVVPNPNLMDNHQAELGEHLAAMGHVVRACCACRACVDMTLQDATGYWMPTLHTEVEIEERPRDVAVKREKTVQAQICKRC